MFFSAQRFHHFKKENNGITLIIFSYFTISNSQYTEIILDYIIDPFELKKTIKGKIELIGFFKL